jgi:hypothetical protein
MKSTAILLAALTIAGASTSFAQSKTHNNYTGSHLTGPGYTTSGSRMNDRNIDLDYRPRTGQQNTTRREAVSDRYSSGKQGVESTAKYANPAY